ncbi:MAG: FixH family protein [Pseudomonadales bacterium]
MTHMDTDIEPWYRQFWPWFIMALPAVAVIACMYTIWVALNSPNPMVKDDYYKEGLAINESIAAIQTAKALGISTTLAIDASNNTLEFIVLPSDLTVDKIELSLLHPFDEKLDQVIDLQLIDNNRYTGTVNLPINRWYVDIDGESQGQSWNIQSDIDISARATTLLKP